MTQKRFAILFAVILLSSSRGFAQEAERTKNFLYLELAGHGLLYSVNYDRAITPNLTTRIGFGALNYEFTDIKHQLRAVPITLNYILGQFPRQLELGVGVDFVSMPFDNVSWPINDYWGVAIIHTIVWRIQSPNAGPAFRIGLTPGWGKRLFWYGGLSLGATF